MRAVWRGGQRVEDDDHAGASALLARMLTRGCGKLDADAVADRVDRLGGSLGGVSGRNSLSLAGEWLSKSWRAGLELFADCILDPKLAASELGRERRMLAEDRAAQDDNPTQVVFRLFNEALYGTHPYARDVLGTTTSIGKLDRATLADFYRDHYPVSGLTLAVVGDVDVDEVIKQVTKRFAVARPRRAVAVAAPQLKLDASREVYRFLDRTQAHLVVGYPGATVDAKDRFALEVLVAVLGGQSGRLFTELRDKQGLVYRVSAHSVEGVDPGFVAVYLSCAPDKLEAAVAAVRGVLDRMRVGSITAEELARAQSYLIGSHQIAMQRRSAVANAIAYHEAYGLGWRTWGDYDSAIRAVTVDDVATAANTYLRADRAVTATVRPPLQAPGATKRSRAKR
jgi:zinc protease